MAPDPKVDRKLQRAFERSLAAVIGDSGTKAIIKLHKISGDRFDPRAIDKSLSQIFGSSREGLSTVQTDVLNGMSSALDIGEEGQSITTSSFAELLRAIAHRYRIRENAGLTGVGFAAGVVSSTCCLGPMAFALLGFVSLCVAYACDEPHFTVQANRTGGRRQPLGTNHFLPVEETPGMQP